MRITGGTHRGRILKTPSGRSIRPTSDKVRQALFNILGPRVAGAVVLDLFAGSGSMGFEALSRGASHVVFVERSRRVLDLIRRNVADLGFEDRATLCGFDVLKAPARLRGLDGPFDVVFIDPPYRLTQAVEPTSKLGSLLETLWEDGIISGTGVAVLEHDRRSTLTEEWRNFRIQQTRTYGDTSLSFLTSKEC